MIEMKEFKSKTQSDLFYAAFNLFSRYGYEGTTVRMIADRAGVSAGQVTFYFGSKENLYAEIMEYVVRQTNLVYDPICDRVYTMQEKGKLDQITALDYLHLIIDQQIDFVSNPDNYDFMMLNFSERWDMPEGQTSISRAITGKIEKLTADLLIAASGGKMDELKARVISRAINGSIVSFGEHPLLLLDQLRDNNELDFMRLYLRSFIQGSIKEAVRMTI